MKVLHLVEVSSFNPILTDIARHTDTSRVNLFAGSLSAEGPMHADLGALGVKTFSLNCESRSGYLSAIRKCATYLKQNQIDVVHTHLVSPSFVGLIAARLARTPVRVLTRHHSDAVLLSGSRIARTLDRVTGNLADRVIAVSQAAKDATVKIDHIRETKVSVVPNGFDWDRISPSANARARIRSEFGIDDELLICSVGRLDRLKGHEILLSAFCDGHLPPTAKLLLVGDGPERSRLQKLSQQLNISDRCIFAGYRSDVYDLMLASDFMVHPSLSEAHSLTIIEALSLGVPVVATNVGAASEVIIPGKTGWLVQPGNVQDLAKTLAEVTIDRSQAHAYAEAGRRLVRSTYSVDRMVQSYEEIYTELLNLKRSR